MIQSPSHYSPVRHNEAARTRRNTVLGPRVRDGFIPLATAAATAKEPLALADFDPARESVAPYFIDYVNRYGPGCASDRVIAGSDAGEPQARMPALPDGAPVVTTLDL